MAESSTKTCPLCNILSPTLKLYISHLRLVHHSDPGFNITCGIDNCTKKFRTFPAFNSHVYRCHRPAIGLKAKLTDQEVDSTSLSSNAVGDSLQHTPSMMSNLIEEQNGVTDSTMHVAQPFQRPSADVKREQATFLLMLREDKQVSQVAITEIVQKCRSLCEQTFTSTASEIKRVLSNADINVDDVPELSNILDNNAPDFFHGIDTSYLLEEYARKHMNYVEPQEIQLSETYYANAMSGAKRRKVSAYKRFYYVPLLETLKQLLSTNEYLSEVLNPHQSDSHNLYDFCDGENFRTHSLFERDPYALQIVAYYDELEVVNPIGTYVKKHKLGCLFFTLSNVRPRFRSVLKAINLVAIVKYEDVQDGDSMDAFLAPFVSDLKKLYCDGVTVPVGGDSCTFFGDLIAFLADNQAGHALGGFKGSMSFALRICRTCYTTRNLSQTCFSEASCTLRTAESHYSQTQLLTGPLKQHSSTTYGINRLSILEEVPGFSVVHGIRHDIMHDLFEGVVPYEVKVLLHHCIRAKYFDLKLLNDRLASYDFHHNKPSLIDERVFSNTDRKIRQSASQMMTLAFELPLIIGDKVDESDKHWEGYLKLVRICQIVISPCIDPDTIEYLRQLIEEKLIVFTELYPGEAVIPKQHYMIHYPSQILRSGPLVLSWTMRHEAKLSFIKRVSRRGNFKNVCLTAVKKHQLWQCLQLESENFLHPDTELSPKSTNTSFDEENEHIQQEVTRLFPESTSAATIHHHNWVKLQNTKYANGVFVLLAYDPISPLFGKVVDIVVVNDTVILSLQKQRSLFFDSHYNAFVVKSTDEFIAVQQHTLEWHNVIYPRTTFVSSDSQCYVTLPYMY